MAESEHGGPPGGPTGNAVPAPGPPAQSQQPTANEGSGRAPGGVTAPPTPRPRHRRHPPGPAGPGAGAGHPPDGTGRPAVVRCRPDPDGRPADRASPRCGPQRLGPPGRRPRPGPSGIRRRTRQRDDGHPAPTGRRPHGRGAGRRSGRSPRRRLGGGGRRRRRPVGPEPPARRARPPGQVGRPLPGMRPRAAARHPDRRCWRAARWSSTTSHGPPTTPTRSTATSTGAGCRTSCRGWRRPSSTSASRRTPCCTGATSTTTSTTWRAGRPPAQRRIEDVLRPGQTILCQVTKNPIGAKGRPPDPGGVPPGPLRGARAQQHRLRHLQAPGRQRAPAPAPHHRRRAAARPRPHRAHGGRGRLGRGAPARRADPARPVAGHRGGVPRLGDPGPPLPRARPGGADPARGAQQRIPRRGHRRPGPLRAGPRPTWPT